MLRDDATFFSTRYEDVVREPDEVWQTWVTEAESGEKKTLYVAEGNEGQWLGVVGGFVRVDPSEVHLVSMWVDPEARGLGVARALIRAIGEWANERGAVDGPAVRPGGERSRRERSTSERASCRRETERRSAPGASASRYC